jgi:AraC-like DNA-binding protein
LDLKQPALIDEVAAVPPAGEPGASALAARRWLVPHCVFKSADAEETRAYVVGLFDSPHRQRVVGRGSEVMSRIESVKAGSITLSCVEYGTSVILDQGVLPGVLMQFPIRGSVEVRCGKQTMTSSPGNFVVLSPGQPVIMLRSADTAHITLRLSQGRLERFAESLIGEPLRKPIVFDLGMPADQAAGRTMFRLVHHILSEVNQSESTLSWSAIVDQIERTLMATLLLSHRHNYSDVIGQPGGSAAPRYVRRAEEYMQAHAHRPITIDDIVAAVGVGARTLSWGFKRYRGVSPLAHLRAIRLDGARKDLTRSISQTGSVTDVALRWGFSHLGRFARDYARRFGELPSETLWR